MKQEELIKSLTKEIDEAASLMKSYTMKLNKSEDNDEDDKPEPKEENMGTEPGEDTTSEPTESSIGGDEGQPEGNGEEMTPGQEEVVDAAQEGQSVGDIVQYAQSLSQEDLEGILQVLMDEYEGRGNQPQQPMESAAQVPPAAAPAADPMASAAPTDDMPPPPAASSEMPPPEMDKAAPEAEMPAQDMQAQAAEAPVENQPTMSLDEAIAQLSPEEKAKLKAALEAALTGGAGAPGAEQPAAAPEMPVQKSVSMKLPPTKKVGASKADGSVKSESSSLMKSLNTMVDSLEKLIPGGIPASTYADSNITVLEKSSKQDHSYTSGFELANRLLVEQKKGNKLVKSYHVAEANTTDASKIGEYLTKLKSMGIEV